MTTALGPLVPGARVLVVGAGVTGRSVLAALAPLGMSATLTDDNSAALQPYADEGVSVADSEAAVAGLTRSEYDVVVVSPGLPPRAPIAVAAATAGVPVWGDVELAWRLEQAGHYGRPRRWLVVTGTNGKTTTTSMVQAMLIAAGADSRLCGNIGDPVLDVLAQPDERGAADTERYLAVELSSFQLHWSTSLRPAAGVVLNIAEDHLDWHGTLAEYAAAKARALAGQVAVVGLDDAMAAGLLAPSPAPVKVGFRLGAPEAGELGVVAGMLVDRAFADRTDGVPLAATETIPVAGPVGVLDALAAAALVRAVGVPPSAIADALASFQVGRHRAERVGVYDEVSYVDDSKATNPHAAEASIGAYPRVVWIAGGLLKGATVDELVVRQGGRLVGAVLIGRDRREVAKALSRHAPDVPVVEVATGEDGEVFVTTEADVPGGVSVLRDAAPNIGASVMRAAVTAARRLSRPGDTVLLAPAGASFDQFKSYSDRGDQFAAAVRDLAAGSGSGR